MIRASFVVTLAASTCVLPVLSSAQPAMQTFFSQQSPVTVCSSAFPSSWHKMSEPRWDSGRAYANWVAEAERRGYSPAYCWALLTSRPLPPLGGQAPPEPKVVTPLPVAPPPDALVASVQTLLNALGFDPGPADGYSGPKTIAAIAAFQRSVGEAADGRPSDALRKRMLLALSEQKPSTPVSPPEPKVSGSGTGFFVNSDTIITNNHVIEGCIDVRLRKRGADVGVAKVMATNRGDDLAALRSDTLSPHHLKVRVGVPVKVAESILVFGYPLSFALSSSGNTTLGNVTALSGVKDDSRFIQVSASVQPGNSGGPVVDGGGLLVGVVTSKLNTLRLVRATGDVPQNVNFAIRSSTIVHFLEANRTAYAVAGTAAVLPATELADMAEAASVQLVCRK